MFHCGFKQKERTAVVSLGGTGGYGSSYFLWLGLHFLLDSETWDKPGSKEDYFTILVFHELLHIWVDDNIANISVLLTKYKDEHEYTREHKSTVQIHIKDFLMKLTLHLRKKLYHYFTDFFLSFLNEKLDDYLKSLTIPSEISELYMAILEDTFKSNEGDRKKQIQGLKERIKDQEDKIADVMTCF